MKMMVRGSGMSFPQGLIAKLPHQSVGLTLGNRDLTSRSAVGANGL